MLRLTILTGGLALALGLAGPAQATEIFLGTPPTPATCAAVVGTQQGAVCPNNLTFNGGTAGNLIATAFSGSPNGGVGTETFLTFKSTATNAQSESGLGESANAPGNAAGCSDAPDCEIAGAASVAITAQVALSQLDIIIGSLQPGENFNIWAGSALGSLVEVATGLTAASAGCAGSAAGTCLFTLATPESVVAVQSAGTGDVLLTAVSVPNAVPEPASLALLGSMLVGLGWGARRRQRR